MRKLIGFLAHLRTKVMVVLEATIKMIVVVIVLREGPIVKDADIPPIGQLDTYFLSCGYYFSHLRILQYKV